jgi:hypothetical protein
VEAIMTHLIDKNFIERANAVLLLGILCAGLAICVLSALAYDVVYWLDDGELRTLNPSLKNGEHICQYF